MDLKKYWEEKHIRYSKQDWIDKPTIFAKFVLPYFPKNGKILDLGCGQGQDSRFFANKNYEVVATEYSEKAVELAQLKDVANKNVSYVVHNLKDKFPFKGNFFDVVYSHLSIQFFDDKVTDQIFNESKRVLKNGGIIAILVNSLTDPEVEKSKFLHDDLYEAPDGLVKRFFSTKSLSKFVEDKFETIILDSNGESYKDETKTLIRYIGKNI